MGRHALHARDHRATRRRTVTVAGLALVGALAGPQLAYAGEASTGGDTTTPATPVTPGTGGEGSGEGSDCDGLSARLIALDAALADDDTTADEAASLVSERTEVVASLALCLDVDLDVDAAGLSLEL